MTNLIQEELNASKAKMLKMIEGTKDLVALTQDNVAIVEAMIRTDSSYNKSFKKEAGPKGKYNGSVAYWMSRLKEILIEGMESSIKGFSFEEIIKNTVEAIDRENSTHLNSDGCGREELAQRIIQEKENLINWLKDPDGTQLALFQKLNEKTHPKDPKYKPTNHTSFASKFCHYACYFLFEGEPEQDNFSIYDRVLKETALPKYIEYYHLENKYKSEALEDYKTYREIINEIREISKCNISRNGFDHLLWYYYK